ncbi:MAG: hypothetical protein JKY34_08775 [Kordiimonadaceae bacterium]|nr:hypothetical protein [Kordiimonadaceae bacterium]
MAYKYGNLSDALGGNPGSRVFRYQTDDTAVVVEGANYFDAAQKLLTVGDAIMASMDLDGTPVLKNYIVTAAAAGAVTVGLQVTAAG